MRSAHRSSRITCQKGRGSSSRRAGRGESAARGRGGGAPPATARKRTRLPLPATAPFAVASPAPTDEKSPAFRSSAGRSYGTRNGASPAGGRLRPVRLPFEEDRIVVPHRPVARPGRDDDRGRFRKERHPGPRHRPGLVVVAAAEGRLPAASVALREVHCRPLPPEQPGPGEPRLREEEIDQAGSEKEDRVQPGRFGGVPHRPAPLFRD
jgi:hypothetical protein